VLLELDQQRREKVLVGLKAKRKSLGAKRAAGCSLSFPKEMGLTCVKGP